VSQPKRKLIEVSLPLEEINAQSAREKSIRHGHPSTLHLWWARRPLATARAVLFAQLVDDPSNFLEDYVAEATTVGLKDPNAWAEHKVKQERERLFDLIRKMVDWDNLSDTDLFDQVRAEIMRSTNDNPPAILDPFAGGGTIPLEAQRLGLEAYASDLNPVAVLINKALIEIPPKFAGRDPAFPHAAGQRNAWPKATGLAEDVRRYGEWMRDEAVRRLGHLYPKAKLPGGGEATVIAWIWARTVTCPNPACRIEMPLVRSWWLGKKKGKEAYVVPRVVGKRVEYEIGHDPSRGPRGGDDGTVGRTGAICIGCGAPVDLDYVRKEGREKRIGEQLIASAPSVPRARVYLAPDNEQIRAADIPRPDDLPPGNIPDQALGFRVQLYGMTEYVDLFTNRQLSALTLLCDLVADVRERVLVDAVAAGSPAGDRLDAGGEHASAYADAVATYLGFAVSRMADYQSSFATWSNHPKNEVVVHVFGRQAIPMVWDYAEANPLTAGNGSFEIMVQAVSRSLERLPANNSGTAVQADAQRASSRRALISTDPTYYDNIGYSDLSDFFYVWLRRALIDVHPTTLSTLLVPKAEELVANPFRHGGKEGARQFFEEGFESVFTGARRTASDDYPITVYYAFKQSESDEAGTASTGWETILGSMVRAGWTVTATWPVRSEFSGRMVGNGTNALASSVVLALRPRPEDAPITDRRGFLAAMKRELGPALRELQQGGIAPVDLPQSAIGPGMAVFSRYAKVIESDGSEMTVRAALSRINDVLDEVLTEQEGDFDPTTRFAIAWYRGNGYAPGAFGDADSLARARATVVAKLERDGILTARAGKVQLYRPADLADGYDVLADTHTSAWEALHHAIRLQEAKGIPAAATFLLQASQRPDAAVDVDLVKELAYLLFQVAEKNGWTKDAISFNGIASSWTDLLEAGRSAPAIASTSATLDFDSLDV
jgi:putative DNA methylase